MKLSKAQQEVVDKMREGWIFYSVNDRYWIAAPARKHGQIVLLPATFRRLKRLSVIEFHTQNGPINTYRLTEQYKNEQK